MEHAKTVRAEALRTFVKMVFQRLEVPEAQADDAADVLIWANVHGVDTHGVRNLKDHYVDGLVEGWIQPRPQFQIEQETAVTVRANGDRGLGMAAGCWAMRTAIAKAQEAGVCFVTMHNSHHFGAAGYYPLMALPHDMIGVSMTGLFFPEGGKYGVPPTFGADALLSTNPLSIAFPTATEPPFLLDMATSVVAFNRILMYQQLGKSIPLGWGVDESGQPTTDPAAVRRALPLGGTRELGSHKGYGLALVVEILCAVLSGGWQAQPSDEPGGESRYTQDHAAHFFGALRIDAFRDVPGFKQGLDALIQIIHASKKEAGRERIYVPGEIEHETAQQRLREGIPLPGYVVEELEQLAQTFDVPLP